MRILVTYLIMLSISTFAQFNKITITNKFISEGANFGDINGDGINDIVTGTYWFEGPKFTIKHQIRDLAGNGLVKIIKDSYDPHKYSNEFVVWVRDINNDGKNDILIVGLPGTPFLAYINPGKESLTWEKQILFDAVDNESPELIDIDGDGIEELICNHKGNFGYAKMHPDAPLKKWVWHAVSKNGKWGRYTHGIGSGDIDGDGKNDILGSHGWYKQPAANGKDWEFFPFRFARGAAQMWVYDVDGDGKNDVISCENAHGYGLFWYKNNGSNSFIKNTILNTKPASSPDIVQFSQLHALQLIDIDGDGLKDLVTGKRFWAHGPKGDKEPNAPAVLYWFKLKRFNGTASFTPKQIDNDSGVGTQLVVGDINNDKLADILVGNKKGVFVFIQKPQK